MVKFPYPLSKRVSEGRRRMLITLKVAIKARKTISKTITPYPSHPRLPTSTLIPYFLPKNLRLKITESKTKPKVCQRKIIKESKNNYLH
jgi:hypothetical protein